MNEEVFICQVYNSIRGITKATPSNLLFFKIENIINRKTNLAKKWIWTAAAGLLILVLLNCTIVFNFASNNPSDVELLAKSIQNHNELY